MTRATRRRGALCLPFLFLLLGLVFASWAARIPAVRDALQLSAGQLGSALLCAGIGALSAFPLAAWMVLRYGQARTALYGGTGLLLAMPCIACARTLPGLMLALVLLGAASGCFDVAINAIGAAAEKQAGRSIMSRLHAWFCVGTLAGALSGSLFASLQIAPQWHFSLLAAGMLPLVWLACRMLERASLPASPAPLTPAAPGSALRLPPRPLLVLGLIGFLGAIAEGGIADWSGLFMRDTLGASDGMAPLAYAGFAAAMLLTRLFADRAKDRFGARRVIASGSVLALAGLGLAISGASLSTAIAGFSLAGAGLAGVFPFVFSAAGRAGSTALAGVATLSYCGALVGPPLLGLISAVAGLPTAFGVLGLLCAVLAWVAFAAHSLR